MILVFKKQFESKIKAGTKIHTIRKDKDRTWSQGKLIEFTNDNNSDIFGALQCTGCQSIFITYEYGRYFTISIDGREIDISEHEELAENSGFDSYNQFYDWFMPKIQRHPDQQYSGRIIHWTNKRY